MLCMTQEVLSRDRLSDMLLVKFGIDNTAAYNHMIDILQHVFPLLPSAEAALLQRVEKIKKNQTLLKQLQTLPVVEQRTDAWYALRKNLITASDFAQALGKGKFGTQKQLIAKKCGYEEDTFNGNLPPLKWGVMFEPVATELYAKKHGVKVHEFGLLQHPSISHFGASPDGISELGVMVEIKCPYRRKITGEVPQQYYFQIQGQLDVAGLDECDYVECEFQTFETPSAFWALCDTDLRQCPMGVVIETTPQTYIYSPIVYPSETKEGCSPRMLREWLEGIQSSDTPIHATTFWNLAVMNVVRIAKDDSFMQEHLPQLHDVWQTIQNYKTDPSQYLKDIGPNVLSKPSASKSGAGGASPLPPAPKLQGYSFIE